MTSVDFYPNRIPKVSVIVPNYNHGRFLDQRIQSILTQTYQDFELILLDDASTDDSVQKLENYRRHPKVKAIVVNNENSGSPYRQWNKGAHIAGGEYLWVAESDDYAAPHFLASLVGALDSQPSAGIAYCRSFKVDSSGNVFGSTADWTMMLHPTRWEKDYFNSGHDECTRYFFRRCVIPNVSSAVFRMSSFQEAGFAHDQMRFCGDYATYVRLLEVSDIVYIAESLNYFRFLESSMRTKMSRAWLHDLECAQIMSYIARHFPVQQAIIDPAVNEFLEKMLRSSFGGADAAKTYLTGFPAMREALHDVCKNPGWRLIQLAVAALARKARKGWGPS